MKRFKWMATGCAAILMAFSPRSEACRPSTETVIRSLNEIRSLDAEINQTYVGWYKDAVSGVISGRIKVAELGAYFKKQRDRRAALQSRLSILKASRAFPGAQ